MYSHFMSSNERQSLPPLEDGSYQEFYSSTQASVEASSSKTYPPRIGKAGESNSKEDRENLFGGVVNISSNIQRIKPYPGSTMMYVEYHPIWTPIICGESFSENEGEDESTDEDVPMEIQDEWQSLAQEYEDLLQEGVDTSIVSLIQIFK